METKSPELGSVATLIALLKKAPLRHGQLTKKPQLSLKISHTNSQYSSEANTYLKVT